MILSRFVALSASLTLKVSLFQVSEDATFFQNGPSHDGWEPDFDKTAEDLKQARMKKRAEKLVSKYPKSDVLTLKSVFDDYDIDGDGLISRSELALALQKQKYSAQRVETTRSL